MKTTLRTVIAVVAGVILAGCASSTPGDLVDTYPIVGYYPACGNEILVHRDTTWYPIVREGEGFHTPGAGGFGRSAPRVLPPGPGDDDGTLWVYEGGHAYFRSDSGRIDTWLTTERQTYTWVC